MPDIFTLIALSFSLMLHNAHCIWDVSEPLNHTLNDDGSVNVTCMILGNENFSELDAKLKMNGKYVCEVEGKVETSGKSCSWRYEDNKFMFKLNNPKDIHNSTFSCEISKIKPFPVETMTGPEAKLFQGCSNAVATLSSPCYNTTVPLPPRNQLEDIYPLLILVLIIVLVMLSFYSIIVTVTYIRLRDQKLESADNLTYVPMQRNVKRHDIDNTEYVDMRELLKRGGSHRDMNHNSHLNNF
uniref:Si:ch211-67e16.3 n=1 Tax=Danio rerio TaxID=7955 RepID=E9QDH7_DANRE|nr:uncharacterized protein si:ch211-67e16.3 [Danio rerio]|eukprot:XP_002663378.2 uncharacterized protein si:ch211-67e16.3 [Danio rerio]